MASAREKRLSLFLNSDELEKHLNGEFKQEKFPLYDHIGWIYTRQALAVKKKPLPIVFANDYLGDLNEFGIIQILFYKDAWVYYLGMMLLSVLFWLIGFQT